MDFDFFNFFAAMGAGSTTGETKEIEKLHSLLESAGIPHLFVNHPVGGKQVVYYGAKGQPEAEPGVINGAGVGSVCSAIETPFSYGHVDDRIEISGLLTKEESENDSVAGGLTAEDVFQRIQSHWEKEGGG